MTLQRGKNDIAGPQEKNTNGVGGCRPPHPHPSHSKERYTSFELLVPVLCRVHRVMGSTSFFRWNLNFLDAVNFSWKKFSLSLKKGIAPSVVLLGKIHSPQRIFCPSSLFSLLHRLCNLQSLSLFFVAGKLLIS